MKKLMVLTATLAMVLAAVAATAREEAVLPEQSASYEFVRGMISYVSPERDLIHVEEEDGSLTTFEVPPETPISYTQGVARLLPPTRDDLEAGQEIEVGFYPPEGPEIMIYPPRRTADQITITVFIPPARNVVPFARDSGALLFICGIWCIGFRV